MRNRLLLAIMLLPLVMSCRRDHGSSLLTELDSVLEDKATYEAYFSDRIRVLRSVLADQNDREQIYNINKRIADAYKAHCFDSTLHYLQQNRNIAVAVSDPEKVAETDMKIVQAYTMAGYHAEAAEILNRYDPETLPESVWPEFVKASHNFYGEMSAYTSSDASGDNKRELRDHYRTELLKLVPENSHEWYFLMSEEAESYGDMEKAREYAGKMVESVAVNSHDYAKACYYFQDVLPDDDPQKEDWIVRSAIADMMCAIKDYTSLNMLSELLYERGDIDRAFRYAADHCMPDALYFNGRLRAWQISQFFPQLEKAYNERNMKHMREMTVLVVVISFFLVILILLFLFIFKRQQILVAVQDKLQASYMQIDSRNRELTDINSKLTSLNSQMQEADKVKQEYITLFLSILSENINTTRQYKNHVLKYIRQGNTKGLMDEIEALPPIDEDIMQFYKMFDETFINLYPDFVERFNELLAEGAAIVPKGDDILTPELRIFALIKLGITDSSKIASLLHYSANTIYNYRAKTKNKARVSRDEFEAAVRAIE